MIRTPSGYNAFSVGSAREVYERPGHRTRSSLDAHPRASGMSIVGKCDSAHCKEREAFRVARAKRFLPHPAAVSGAMEGPHDRWG